MNIFALYENTVPRILPNERRTINHDNKIISVHPNMDKGYADNITQLEKASTDSKGTCDTLPLDSLARLSKLRRKNKIN